MEKSFFKEDAEIIEITKAKTETKEDAVLLTEWKPKITELLQDGKVYQNPELSPKQFTNICKQNPWVISWRKMLISTVDFTNIKGKLFTQFSFYVQYCLSYFTAPILASILSVACGTARKRALSISFPVTRQIP